MVQKVVLYSFCMSVIIFSILANLDFSSVTRALGRISHYKLADILCLCSFQLFDPGQVLYIYQSPAGYGLIALHLCGWLWFVIAVFFTLKKFPSKRRFYIPFTAFYTVW